MINPQQYRKDDKTVETRPLLSALEQVENQALRAREIASTTPWKETSKRIRAYVNLASKANHAAIAWFESNEPEALDTAIGWATEALEACTTYTEMMNQACDDGDTE